MGNTFKVKYVFGAWQILLKKPFDVNMFLSHMKYGRKIVKPDSYSGPLSVCFSIHSN